MIKCFGSLKLHSKTDVNDLLNFQLSKRKNREFYASSRTGKFLIMHDRFRYQRITDFLNLYYKESALREETQFLTTVSGSLSTTELRITVTLRVALLIVRPERTDYLLLLIMVVKRTPIQQPLVIVSTFYPVPITGLSAIGVHVMINSAQIQVYNAQQLCKDSGIKTSHHFTTLCYPTEHHLFDHRGSSHPGVCQPRQPSRGHLVAFGRRSRPTADCGPILPRIAEQFYPATRASRPREFEVAQRTNEPRKIFCTLYQTVHF